MVRAEKRIKLFLCEHVDEVRTDSKPHHRRCLRQYQNWPALALPCPLVRRLHRRRNGRIPGRGRLGYNQEKDTWAQAICGIPTIRARPAPFPTCPWAVQVGDNPVPTKLGELGHWNWESGFDMDTIIDAEAIRDNNFRGMYGVWEPFEKREEALPDADKSNGPHTSPGGESHGGCWATSSSAAMTSGNKNRTPTPASRRPGRSTCTTPEKKIRAAIAAKPVHLLRYVRAIRKTIHPSLIDASIRVTSTTFSWLDAISALPTRPLARCE